MKPKLKAPGTKRLKLKCDVLLSTSAVNFNLRRYNAGSALAGLSRRRRYLAAAGILLTQVPAAVYLSVWHQSGRGSYTRPLFRSI
jgi:hypothetical protein